MGNWIHPEVMEYGHPLFMLYMYMWIIKILFDGMQRDKQTYPQNMHLNNLQEIIGISESLSHVMTNCIITSINLHQKVSCKNT